MALDGAFLHHLRQEIETAALGARVEKIYQPNREEMVFFLRTRTDHFKLLLSARANSARVHFTRFVPENPKQPPMLCMLLRKRLSSAKLAAVRQPDLERALFLDFDAINELGDEVRLTLAVEIMGRYSNLILVDENGKIIDALKRVDAEMSSERLVLPGLTYFPPPPQEKLCLLDTEPQQILERMKASPKEMELSKGLLSAMQGVSPIVCRELEHLTGRGQPLMVHELTKDQEDRLLFFLGRLRDTVRSVSGEPYMVINLQQKPMDFSFFQIQQYGTGAITRRCGTFSELLDEFYEERDRLERMRARSQDLLRLLSTNSDRLSRKINNQRAELAQCAERDQLRVNGDLLSASLYQLEKGMPFAELVNFYDEAQPVVKIKLDPALTPAQNAQKYYKEYRKARTAEEKLTEQIEQATQELAYLDTVFDELSRAATEQDLSEIRLELMDQGYLRRPKGKQKPPRQSAPMEFTVSGGFRLLVGRNNRQNDQLTLKKANNRDIWFHTKNIPGSHAILVTDGKKPSEEAMVQAASIAAWYSRGKDSSQVPVDYTEVRNVSKPQGAKPGMVIYVSYHTMFVTPLDPETL